MKHEDISLTEHHSPMPRRGKKGNDILGPQNPDRMRQEPDTVCPPETDHGKMPNMKWFVQSSACTIASFADLLVSGPSQTRTSVLKKAAGQEKPPSANSPPPKNSQA